jgi:hypothetical protein
MNINVIVVALLTTIIGLYSWKAFLHQNEPPPSQLPWVPIDANKHRSFVNQTRDAGMFTERTRRVAIIGANNCGVNLKSPNQKHFNNGVVETFLTGICAVVKPIVPDPVPPSPSFGWDVIIDGTFADNSLQTVTIEGNGGPSFITIDGNPRPNFTEPEIVVENSDSSPSFFDMLFEGNGWDFSMILDGNVF